MNRVEGTTAEGTTALQHYSREAQSFAGANQSQSFIGANQSFKPPFTMRQFSRSGEAYMLTNSRLTRLAEQRRDAAAACFRLSLVTAYRWCTLVNGGGGQRRGLRPQGLRRGCKTRFRPWGGVCYKVGWIDRLE